MKNQRFRAILAQSTAVTIKNILLLDFGATTAFSVILIPALTGLGAATNQHETIHITATQASWLGSMSTMVTILGSLLSGIVTEPIGRKRALMVVNIPHLLGWFLLYYSTSLAHVFIGMALLGLGVGLMEAPMLTYVGEICEPSVRDVMLSVTGVSAGLANLAVYMFGLWFDWRTVALLCSSIPVTAIILLLFVPETPIWLLSQHRDKEASRSLQWLRGWVSEKAIEKELNELKEYRESANSCANCQAAKLKCGHPPPTFVDKINGLFHASYAKPMIIVTVCVFFSAFIGTNHLNPYLVQILNTYETPVSAASSTIWLGLATFFGCVAYMVVAKFFSKRTLYMTCIATAAVTNLWLGLYGLYYLPANSKSYEHANKPAAGENGSYVPLINVFVMRFVTNGLVNISLMYASELFPLKSRCIAAGIAQGISYTLLFIATKTFYDFEYLMNMSVSFCIYGVAGFIGLYATYRIFPATEGRTLEEIEKHFSDRNTKLTDWKVPAKISEP